ncbi:hypothetical protein TKK_0005054 [Trichogramma kaykai]
MTCYLLDVVGFRDNENKLIVKELALMPISFDMEPQSWIFNPPFHQNQLDEDTRLLNDHASYWHGLSWDSGEIDYKRVGDILREHLKNAKTIYVTNFVIASWLQSYDYMQFFNLSTAANYQNHFMPMIERKTECSHHHHTASPIIDCAVKNVKQMLVNIMLYAQ